MVITNSDSNTTLVSLNNNDNNKQYDDTTTTKVDKTTGLIHYVVQTTTTTTTSSTSTGRIPAPLSTDGTPTELLISVPVVKEDTRNEYQLFWVQPIEFNSCNITNFDSLLQLEDDILLQYTSTSPNVEEDGFCEDVRSSLQFLKESKSSQSQSQHPQLKFKQQQQQEQQGQFFGTNLNRPMVFAKRICTTTSSTAGGQQQQQQWKQLPL
ncbi:hypothetical protein FRACYDRAFT_246468 [Fragilariopsis cylindrus CCMP1102]|uniref:Uncharacterized protein n=1 Tax=Fragilariopsis cylindrus CCMP1102 TaxID=635003 RepID=A0A1E7EXX3_9STRA|nr:hypothetical protein FRACYDRAFT_246468 [Fragilariopsis cylindrus CCMP1102]|eukprot:OEU10717.1 hypothetical protein FRACYDRAFT_246468 [Fragilariopsis cylindrus CCMP1102]